MKARGWCGRGPLPAENRLGRSIACSAFGPATRRRPLRRLAALRCSCRRSSVRCKWVPFVLASRLSLSRCTRIRRHPARFLASAIAALFGPEVPALPNVRLAVGVRERGNGDTQWRQPREPRAKNKSRTEFRSAGRLSYRATVWRHGELRRAPPIGGRKERLGRLHWVYGN